jgi:hypothetical protein
MDAQTNVDITAAVAVTSAAATPTPVSESVSECREVSGRSHILCGRFDWDLLICCVYLSRNHGVEFQQQVHWAWCWVRHMEALAQSNVLGKRGDHPFHGVRFTLPKAQLGSGGEASDAVLGTPGSASSTSATAGGGDSTTLDSAFETAECKLEGSAGLSAVVYSGAPRQAAMRLCGWEGITTAAVPAGGDGHPAGSTGIERSGYVRLAPEMDS